MKATVIAAALALVACGLPGAARAQAEDFASHVKVTSTMEKGELHVTLEPTGGYHVNTAYPSIRVMLTAPKGVTLGKTTLKKADARYENPIPGDKAARAVFTTTAKGAAKKGAKLSGSYKMVICSPKACSPPFKGHFEVGLSGGGAS